MKLLKLENKIPNGKFKGNTVSKILNKGNVDYLKWWLPRNKDYKLHTESIRKIQTMYKLNMGDKLLHLFKSFDKEDEGYEIAQVLLKLNKRKRIKTIFTNVKIVEGKPYVKFDIPFGNKNKLIKIGKFINKTLSLNGYSYDKSELTKFIDICVTKSKTKILGYTFKVFKGEDIIWAYDENNYHSPTKGTLGNSCEKHEHLLTNKKIYAINDNIEILALIHEKSGKVAGRALLWNNVKVYQVSGGGNGIKKDEVFTFMDRIYTNNHSYVGSFINYAKERGYLYKSRQSHSTQNGFIYKDKKYLLKIKMDLDSIDFHNTPYFDTFKYMSKHRKIVSNHYDMS